MLDWSLLGELYSFFVLLILYLRYQIYERKTAIKGRRKLFVSCLLASMGFIVLNVLCVVVLDSPGMVPRWVSVAMNTLYFQGAICVCSQYAFLLFSAMLEHVYDKHCLRRATIMLGTVNCISSGMLLRNLGTGMVFSIDPAGIYHRGPMNRVFYLLLVAELVFLGICFFRNRPIISDQMLYVMQSLPPVIILLCVCQVLFPNILLNGTISCVASLVIFIGFRSHTEERDSLTGAGSRKSFIGELGLRSGSHQSVQFVQVSILNMRDLNLRHSHAVGDALLYEVGHYLRHCCQNARVFRTGSTTFTLMTPLGGDEEAESLLQAIQTKLLGDWILGEEICKLTVAIADLRTRDLSDPPSELVERIEYTMSLAKKNPPLARFDEEAARGFSHRTELIELLRRSIEERRFRVVYQPIYCCHRDLFCSAEALLRLSDDNGNPISPEVFVSLAEETGMIDELTWIVVEESCKLLSSGKLPRLESISINLPTMQLMDPNLPVQIQTYLEQYQVSPSQLKLEVTERFIFHDSELARVQMTALQELGVEIYMDDFGTGYSNLSSVIHFPFTFVKLDRSLIAPVVGNDQASIMVRALMKLFRDLGKRVIVEGVEEQKQVDYLRQIDVDMIQGFYFARPTPPDQLTEYFG